VELGSNYPRPMVDHAEASKRNIARMAEAYHTGSAGRGEKRKHPGATRRGGKSYKMSK
jgi:hypothetical protein